MALNVTTLLFSTLVSAVLMIVALGVCVDMKQAPALRSWMLSLAGQAFGFAFLIAAATVAPRLMASIGVFLMSLSVGMMHITIVRFVHRPLRKSIYIAPALLLGVLHPLIYGDTQLTVGITNLFFGVQGLWAAQDLLRVAGTIRWRWLVGVVAVANSVLVLARTYLVTFHFDAYPAFAEPHPINIAGMLMINASMVLFTIGFLLAHRDEAEQALYQLATFDSLTGLYNRRAWMERSSVVLGDQRSKERPMLMLLDLDHFKQVNDTMGHPMGDKVLKIVGEVVRAVMRRDDLAGRYGGEEFGIVLRDCSLADCALFDARMRERLRAWTQSELGFEVTFSAGAVVCTPGMELAEAIKLADAALYRAKAQGRNQTVL